MRKTRETNERPLERRRYLRLPADAALGTCSVGEVTLLDISPMGLGLATTDGATPAPGERHLVIVEDRRAHSIEALAEVRWCVRRGASDRCRLGLAFVSILRDDAGGRWSGVLADPGAEQGQAFRWTDDLSEERPPERPSVVRMSDRRWQRRRKRR